VAPFRRKQSRDDEGEGETMKQSCDGLTMMEGSFTGAVCRPFPRRLRHSEECGYDSNCNWTQAPEVYRMIGRATCFQNLLWGNGPACIDLLCLQDYAYKAPSHNTQYACRCCKTKNGISYAYARTDLHSILNV
jgi:hypothetical protein